MTRQRTRRSAPPLDPQRLEALALHYVGRYATTRAKLLQYMARKLRERGWEDEKSPPLDAIADRFVELGYVDDRAVALSKEASHAARGLGPRRLSASLRSAGIAEEDGADALELASSKALESALRLARRRGLGPFAAAPPATPREREKAIASLIRGGHGFDISRAIIQLRPGDEDGLSELRDRFSARDG